MALSVSSRGAKGERGDPGPPSAASGWPVSSDKVMYVSRQQGSDANDGFSWAEAKQTIQAAINATTGSGWVFYVGAHGNGYVESLVIDTRSDLRIVGTATTGANAGAWLLPVADDSTILYLNQCTGIVFENFGLRNHSRAGWRGIFIHVNGSSLNQFRNVNISNNASTCNPANGVLGGTALMLTRGERNRFYDGRIDGTHLAIHIGREASLPILSGLQNVNNFHGLRIDSDAGCIYDSLDSITSWVFQAGSTSILNASGGQFAAVGTGAAQTWKHDTRLDDVDWVPYNARNAAKVTVGAGSFGLTVRGVYKEYTTSGGAQNPVDGGALTLSSVVGLPTSGFLFWVNGEVISYNGISGSQVLDIRRAQAGTSNLGSMNNQRVYIPTGDCLAGRITPTALEIVKIEAGVVSAPLATAALTSASGTVRYLDFEPEDDDLCLTAFSADPWNPGDPHWLSGTPLATLTHTLTGADATKFGAGIAGFLGHRIDATDTVWRVDDSRMRGYAGSPSGGGRFTSWKDTSNVVQKKRDGTTLNRSTNPASKSWEFYAYTQDNTNGKVSTGSNSWETVDLVEGVGSAANSWGDSDSDFTQCVIGGPDAYYVGDNNHFTEIRDTNGGRMTVTGKRNTLTNCPLVSYRDQGYLTQHNSCVWGIDAADKQLPNGVSLSASSDGYVRQRVERMAFRVPVGALAAHAFAEGSVTDTLAIAAASGVGNGYLIPIYVGVQQPITWDQIALEVTVLAGVMHAAIFHLDPITLAPTQPAAEPVVPHPLTFNNLSITSTGEKTFAVGPEITESLWVGLMVWQLSTTTPSFRAMRSTLGSPAPYGYPAGTASNAGPPIFLRYSVAGTNPGDLPTFHSYSDVGPVVRLRRSA